VQHEKILREAQLGARLLQDDVLLFDGAHACTCAPTMLDTLRHAGCAIARPSLRLLALSVKESGVISSPRAIRCLFLVLHEC